MDNNQPTPSFGIPAYFQGRPNSVFIEKYGTVIVRAA